MQEYRVRRNMAFAAIEFIVVPLGIYLSYRLIIQQGGVALIGLWASLTAWTSLGKAADFGVGTAALQLVASRGRSQSTAIVDTSILLAAPFYALTSLVTYFVGNFALTFTTPLSYVPYAQALLPGIMLGLFLSSLSHSILACLQGLHLGYIRSTISVFCSLLQTTVSIGFYSHFSLFSLVYGLVAQHSVAILVGWIFVSHATGWRLYPRNFSGQQLRVLLTLGGPIQLATISSTLFDPAARFLVGVAGGLHYQGLYELAYRTVFTVRGVIVSAVTASLPKLSALAVTDFWLFDDYFTRSDRRLTRATIMIFASAGASCPLVSILWTGTLDTTFMLYMVLLAVGLAGNTMSALAYNASIALRNAWPLVTTQTGALVALLFAGSVSALAHEPTITVAFISVILLGCGMAIKIVTRNALKRMCGNAPSK
jgi:hypothetical protein